MYTYVLRQATIIDGTGGAPYCGDVCLSGDRIAEIIPHYEGPCEVSLDLTGKILCPGFIDIHTHSDTVPLMIKMNPESKLYQGVTLEITGNCGISHIPLSPEKQIELTQFYNSMLPLSLDYIQLHDESVSDYAKRVSLYPPATNYGALVGHGTLRGAVMGFDMIPATPQNQEDMEALLNQELERGAFGMSLGLIYPPSSFATIQELTGLARVLQKKNRILSVHMRSESDGIFQAMDEMLDIAKETGVHLQISHLKLIGKAQWGQSQRLLSRLEQARRDGCKVTCDQYPFHASSTGLSALLPGWAHSGGNTDMVKRVQTPGTELLDEISQEIERRGGAGSVVVVDTQGICPQVEGKTLEDIAALAGCTPAVQATELLSRCGGVVTCIYFAMDMEDVCTMMKDLTIAVASDGTNLSYKESAGHNYHPRNFGTFPRFLEIVRQRDLMPLEKAIYKITGLPRTILNLKDRGIIATGAVADITIFDYEQVAYAGTFQKSAVRPTGIEYVFIAGEPALLKGEQTDARRGRVLLRTE